MVEIELGEAERTRGKQAETTLDQAVAAIRQDGFIERYSPYDYSVAG